MATSIAIPSAAVRTIMNRSPNLFLPKAKATKSKGTQTKAVKTAILTKSCANSGKVGARPGSKDLLMLL